MKLIAAVPLTADAFRPFGEVIEPDNAREIRLINGGTTTRFHDVAPVDTASESGRTVLSIFRGKSFALPFRVEMMERHPLGTQCFVPLEDRPFLVLVAPDRGGVPGEPVAFLVPGRTGVSYARGTWHHPLVALHERSDFLVVDRGGPGSNLEEHRYSEPFEVTAGG